MAIETVEDAQHELAVSIEEMTADMGDDAPDEGSMASDLFVGLSYQWPTKVAAEVARREFGYVPHSAPPEVHDQFKRMFPNAGEW